MGTRRNNTWETMDRLQFSTAEEGGAISRLFRIAAAVFLACASFAVLLSQLGLSYSFSGAFSGSPVGGLVSAWNAICERFGSSRFILLPKYEGGSAYGLFLTIVLLCFVALAIALVKSRILASLLVFLLPELLLFLILGAHVDSLLLLLYLSAVLLAYLVMRTDAGALSGAALIGAAAICACLIALLLGGRLTKRPDAIEAFREKAGAGIARAYFGEDPLGHGEKGLAERVEEEGTAMTIQMERPSSIYLKGFVGTSFDGKSWERLSNEAAYEAEDLMRALEANGFSGATELSMAESLALSEAEAEAVSIEVKDADRRRAYVPYDLTDAGDLGDASCMAGDLFSAGTGRLSRYRYEALCSESANWPRIASALFAGDREAEETGAYLEKESHFNHFVYSHYTVLRGADRRLIAAEFGELPQAEAHIDYRAAIEEVRSYLEEQFVYTETPGGAKGEGLTEFFSGRKGYDVHFATLSTLLFRYLGIPARYVEGYLVTPEDAEAMRANEAYEIGMDAAHAWTEIYLDGVGFVPIEVSPPYADVMEQPDLTIGIESEGRFGEAEYLQSEEEGGAEEATEEQMPTPGISKQFRVIAIILLAAFLGICAILLLRMLLSVIMRTARRRRIFAKAPAKEAVAAMYAYMSEKNLPVTEQARALGNRAAYSKEELGEEARDQMRAYLKESRREGRQTKKHGLRVPAAAQLLALVLVAALASACGKGAALRLPEDLQKMRELAAEEVLAGAPQAKVAPIGGEWAFVGLADSGVKLPDTYEQQYMDDLRAALKIGRGALPEGVPTDYARACLALAAAGADPREVDGVDLTLALDDYASVTEQGINAAAYALIAANACGIRLDSEDAYLKYLPQALEEGGYYEMSDMSDFVSMTLEALAPYQGNEEVDRAIARGLAALSEAQKEDGSLGNCEATAY